MDPFGQVNGWSTANPSATSRVSTWPITSPWVHTAASDNWGSSSGARTPAGSTSN
jgi:hypothetical protein